MSTRKTSAQGDAEGESEEDRPSEEPFKFIDQSNFTDRNMRKKNRARVRSHVVKVARRRERENGVTHQLIFHKPTKATTANVVLPPQLAASSTYEKLLRLGRTSPWSSPGVEIISSLISPWKWTPLAHRMVHHMVTTVIPCNVPTNSPDIPSSAAIQVWYTLCSSRAAVHAIIYGSAAHRDAYNPSAALAFSSEALEHRGEAIRLINQEISNVDPGNKPSDALLFAVMCMTDDPLSAQDFEGADTRTARPFRLSKAAQGWQQPFLNLRHSKVHSEGLLALVERAGGLSVIQNRGIAKMISHHDVLMAMHGPRAPKEPFVEVEEIQNRVNDLRDGMPTPRADSPQDDYLRAVPSPSPEPRDSRTLGSSLLSLRHLLRDDEQLVDMLVHLQRVCAAEEVVSRGGASNDDPVALMGDKDALHHTVLSIPARPGSMTKGSLYEPVRLVALVFELGILFPLPVSVGALARVVVWMKAALEDTSMELLRGEIAEAMVWILFVGGLAAKGMPERDWFLDRLQVVIKQQGITKWADLKHLLTAFVWMPIAMDEGAMDLWDDVRNGILGS